MNINGCSEIPDASNDANKTSGYFFDTLNEMDDTELLNLEVQVKYFTQSDSVQILLRDRVENAFHDGVYFSIADGWSTPIAQAFEAINRKVELLEADIAKKAERVAELERMTFGVRSEKTKKPPKVDAAPVAENVVPIEQAKEKRRKSLPDDLPRDTLTHVIPESQQHCSECGGDLHTIHGWDQVTEQLIVIKEHVRVRRHIQKTYGCRCCEEAPVTAPKPPSMIPGSIYDAPETLAYLATRKFQYSLPFYRLEQFFEQAGVPFSRTTMARVLNECVDRRLTALYELLKEELRAEHVVHGDETNLQVLKEPGRKAQTKSFLWAYASTVHSAHPVVIFDYQQTRSGEHAKAFLTDGQNPFSGVLVCDGFKGYNRIPGVTLAGCWSHARRKFEAIIKELSPEARSTSKAQEVFDLINSMFAIERRIKKLLPDSILTVRQAETKPIIDDIKKWLHRHKPLVPPETGLGKAISYTLNEWDKLVRFLDDGQVPIDNNEDERQIRHFAIGRKNWLFADSVAGGYTNAVFYSLVRSAVVNGLDPYEYLKTVFTKLPAMKKSDEVRELLPWNVILDQAPEAKLAA